MLQIIDPTRVAGFITSLNDYDAILGETTSGKDITLLRCFDRSARGGLGTLGSREIFANGVLVGFHGEARDPLVSTATVVFRHAAHWWGQTGISVDQSKWPDATVHYRRPTTVQLFNDRTLEIKVYGTLESLPSGPDHLGQLSLNEEIRLEINSNAPRTLSAVQEIVHACQDLLSIACQRYCGVERLTVFRSADGHPEGATFHATPFFKQPHRGRDDAWSGLLYFNDMKDRPTEVFGSWLEHAERLMPVRALYFLAIYGQNWVEGRFLALAQAVEAFHRRCRGGHYLETPDYEARVLVPLTNAIPAGIGNSLSESLRNRIKFGNEYSLRKRLTLLIREHKMALDKVVPNAERFIEPIALQRNSMTHFPAETVGARLDTERCVGYNLILRLLLDLCFLKTMGFSDEDACRFVERCEDYKARAQHLFRPPAGGNSESGG